MSKIKRKFDECPYFCNDGMVLDTNLGMRVPCPYCSNKRKELIDNGELEEEGGEIPSSLSDILGIKNRYLSDEFLFDLVIPEAERLFIDEESYNYIKERSEKLYKELSAGILPEESYCFGISIKGDIERFVFPMLARAYKAGYSVCKFISCSEYSRIAFEGKESILDFFNVDILMMLINEGCLQSDLNTAKGLVQSRAIKGRPTIFVTTWTVEACSQFLGFKNNNSMALATPVFVEYKSAKKKGHSSYINKILGVENAIIDSSTDTRDEQKEVSVNNSPVLSMSELFKL